jgi:hypothetical protein
MSLRRGIPEELGQVILMAVRAKQTGQFKRPLPLDFGYLNEDTTMILVT